MTRAWCSACSVWWGAAHGNTETIDKEELQKALDEQHSTQQNAQ